MIRVIASAILVLAFHSFGSAEPSPPLRPTVTFGTGVLIEKNNDAITESTRLPLAFGLGVNYLAWSARLEYSSFRTADGNSTVSVQRFKETALAWAAYEFSKVDGWMPYVALGTGVARTGVQTRMASAVESADGAWSGMFAFAAGIRANWMSRLAVRPEVRYESAETFKTKDARMGAFVQLDYLF